MSEIGSRIGKYREKSGLSQLELSEMLDVSRQAISKWETGVAVPELPKLVRMAEIFGISLDELVLGKEGAAEETAASEKQAASEPRSGNLTKTIVGCFFLIAGLVLCTALLIIYRDPTLLLLFIPFGIFAFFCLKPFRRAALWCFATVLLIFSACLCFGTAKAPMSIFDPALYTAKTNEGYIIMLWLLFGMTLVFICTALYSYRNTEFDFSKKKNIALAVLCASFFSLLFAVPRLLYLLGDLLFGPSKPTETVWTDKGVVYGIYTYGWREDNRFAIAVLEYSVETALLIGFIICLVPTFWWISHLIKEKRN